MSGRGIKAITGEYDHSTRARFLPTGLNRSRSLVWKYGNAEGEEEEMEGGEKEEEEEKGKECPLRLSAPPSRPSSGRACPRAAGSHWTLSTAMLGALSSIPRRIFFAGCCIMSKSAVSSALSGRTIADSPMLGVLSVTDATGDERDDVDADTSGGVAPAPLPLLLPLRLLLLFERAFVGSLT